MKRLFAVLLVLLLFLGVYIALFPTLTQMMAERGGRYSQHNLGKMYERGQSVSQDFQQAVYWYRKSAEQGHVDAQYDLGVMYKNGKGVAQNHTEAVKWYQKAAEQGDVDAQFNLGWMYYNGQGVAQNYALAYALYNLAATSGDKSAEEKRGLIAKEMTPAQIEEGKAIASQWKTGQPFPTTSKTGRTGSK